jgi:hypothetical protein
MTVEVEEKVEIICVVSGEGEPRSLRVETKDTAGEILRRLAEQLGRQDLEEISVEDADDALPEHVEIGEVMVAGFVVLHVSDKGQVQVTVTYNGRSVDQAFRSNATVRKIIKWAISPGGLKLEGEPSDFQLKRGPDVLAADQHLGQVAMGAKHVELSLVFKVKPQG